MLSLLSSIAASYFEHVVKHLLTPNYPGLPSKPDDLCAEMTCSVMLADFHCG